MTTFDRDLDVRGLNCPLPILRAKKVLGDLSAGQVLKVMATDPGSVKDFQAFCKQTGNEPEIMLSVINAFANHAALRQTTSVASEAQMISAL